MYELKVEEIKLLYLLLWFSMRERLMEIENFIKRTSVEDDHIGWCGDYWKKLKYKCYGMDNGLMEGREIEWNGKKNVENEWRKKLYWKLSFYYDHTQRNLG